MSIVELEGDIDTLHSAQATSLTRASTSYPRRDFAFRKIVADLDYLRAYVQYLVDNNPGDAATLAANVGMVLVRPANDVAATRATGCQSRALLG